MTPEEIFFFEMSAIIKSASGDDDWSRRRKELVALATSGSSPYKFYTWSPVISSMWPDSDGYAVFQIKFLDKLENWQSRWLPAMRDKLCVTSSQWGSNVSFASMNHVYNLAHFEKIAEIGLDEMDYIFEFGAGTANMCRIIHNLGFRGRYEIFDFPEMRPLQKFYLTESGIDISKVRWLDSQSDANVPSDGKRLLISIAAVEESPRDNYAQFLEIGKRATHFLTGGQLLADVHITLHDITRDSTKWSVWDTSIPPGYYIGIGAPK